MSTYLKRISVICFIFTVIIGQVFMPIISHAQELNTTGLVDSFTFDKTELNYGERSGIRVDFSDKSGNQMKAGDTLTLTLPAELTGYSKRIDLKNDAGVSFGTCEVTKTNVVCTFNDTVEKLQNIRGYLYLEFKATSNVGVNQTIPVDTNLGTGLATQRVTIKGPTESTGSSSFIYKTGEIYPDAPNEVKWELNVNASSNKEQLDADIVLTDTLQSGQTLKQEGFIIIVGNTGVTPQQFIDQGYGTITLNGNSFSLRGYKDQVSGKGISIRYSSIITDSGMNQDEFYNDYTIDYQILNQPPVTVSKNAWVKNINAGGGAQGDLPSKGTLRIVKHIEGNEGKVIPGVSFKLYTESGQQIGDSYTTNQDGVVEAPNLAPGNYYVQEISAPNYVEFDPQTKIPFTIKKDDVNGIKLMVPNKLKTTSVAGTKTWEGDNINNRPETIKVDLLQDGKVIATKEVTAANGWKYEFENLPAVDTAGKAYKYEVKEQPVSGYQSHVKGYDIINIKIQEAPEVEDPGKEETIEELEDSNKPEEPKVTEEPNELEKPEVTDKPEIHVKPEEEQVEEETTEELKEEKPEEPKVTEEPNELEKPEVTDKPEIWVKPEEEQVEEETTEEIKEEKPEEPKVTEEPNELEKPEVTDKPEIHVTPEEEQVEEETTEEIKEEKPEEPKVTEEPNELEKPEVTDKPEIHVKPEEEQVEEETTEEIKEEKPEEPKVTEEPNELEKPEVTDKPEIHVKPEEEQVEEETTEEIKEEKPEEPKVTEEPNVLEKPEVTEKPEIHVKPEEEQVEEETTEEIKEEKPEEPKVTEEPNVLEKPEVTEKPEILVTPGEESNKEETTEELEEPLKPEEPKVTEEPNVLEKPEVKEKPEILVKPKEEENKEETTEEIEESLKPEEPKVTEEPNVLEKPEVKEKPEILVKPIEEENKEETTKELTEEKPEEPKVTEEPNVLEKPEVKEKPEVSNKQEVQDKVEVQNKQEVQSKQDVQNKSEVPSSKENNKQSKLLPQTGGTSTESTSLIAGMFALIFGAMLFRRKKN
ncbi:Cna B-type domain-containing protein [Bacillus mycoides]|uniref:Cna B-type domain-containing protein n=1 Tax=Bacillus mycoides TaxID=1405 RepID=UPI001C02B05F|nr:Cna B-type domain-containing protein [Bacillus mycoides]QWI48232.1 Cna B-type domain-containing protein [Bacillus mycoides]